MSKSAPAALARSRTRWLTQSGFHGRECAGSLENRKADGARVTPTAASAVVVSSRVSWTRAHVTGSMAMCRSWCVLVSFRSFWPALTGPAGAREVPTSHQPGVQRVQERAADLADLRGPDCRLDRPADITDVAFPCGYVPPGCRHVLVEQLGHGDGRVGLASRYGLLQQLAELDLGRPFGLTCPAQPDLSARQRVDPGVYLHTPGTPGESLYVSGRSSSHDIDGTSDHRHRSTIRSTDRAGILVKSQVGRVGLEPTTGGL